LQVGDVVGVLAGKYHGKHFKGRQIERGTVTNINNGNVTIKYMKTLDNSYGKAPWTGGKIEEETDHIKSDEIISIHRYID
jgi:hypothetical protein